MTIRFAPEPAISGLLCLHVGLLLAAPYTPRYHLLKKAALLAGVCAAVLIMAGGANISLTQRAAIVAILAGYVGLFSALCFANFSIRQGYRNFCRALSPRTWLRLPASALLLVAIGALMEECIWRAGIQIRLGNSWPAIVAIALIFHRCHLVRSRKVRLPKMLDIICFSLLSGVVFWTTRSLPAVVFIHAVRNFHLFGLRYHHEAKYYGAMEAARSALQAKFLDKHPGGLFPVLRRGNGQNPKQV